VEHLIARFWNAMREHRGKLGTALGAVLALTIGQGSCWRWKEHELAVTNQRVQSGARIEHVMLEAIKASALYARLQDCDPADTIARVQNRKVALSRQLELLQNEFTAVERDLAQLDGRPPRQVDLNFIPPPAPNIEVEVHVDGKVIPQPLDTTPPAVPPECPALE
jgi:hypothetical protein